MMKQRKKWKRLTLAEMEAFNKKGFDEAKKEFDKAHGEVFRYEVKWRCGTYRREFSWADQTEKAIVKMLEQYESRTLSTKTFIRDSGNFSITFLSAVFVVTDQFFGVGFNLDEDDIARREEEDYWEPLVVFYELEETAQASRIRNLFLKLVAKGAALAHEVGILARNYPPRPALDLKAEGGRFVQDASRGFRAPAPRAAERLSVARVADEGSFMI